MVERLHLFPFTNEAEPGKNSTLNKKTSQKANLVGKFIGWTLQSSHGAPPQCLHQHILCRYEPANARYFQVEINCGNSMVETVKLLGCFEADSDGSNKLTQMAEGPKSEHRKFFQDVFVSDVNSEEFDSLIQSGRQFNIIFLTWKMAWNSSLISVKCLSYPFLNIFLVYRASGQDVSQEMEIN